MDFFDWFDRTTIFMIDASRFGVLSESGSWMGLIVETKYGYDAFSTHLPHGMRVGSFNAALGLIEQTETATYHEDGIREEATDGD